VIYDLRFPICDLQFGPMNEQELIARTKKFGLRILTLVRALPKTVDARAIADQLIQSGTSVGANYRAACKARSRAEFVSKLGTVEEEADETASWIELLIDGKFFSEQRLQPLLKEARELVAIFAAPRKTTQRNTKSQIANRKLQIRRLERSSTRKRPKT
jgi:four helix bundle protein